MAVGQVATQVAKAASKGASQQVAKQTAAQAAKSTAGAATKKTAAEATKKAASISVKDTAGSKLKDKAKDTVKDKAKEKAKGTLRGSGSSGDGEKVSGRKQLQKDLGEATKSAASGAALGALGAGAGAVPGALIGAATSLATSKTAKNGAKKLVIAGLVAMVALFALPLAALMTVTTTADDIIDAASRDRSVQLAIQGMQFIDDAGDFADDAIDAAKHCGLLVVVCMAGSAVGEMDNGGSEPGSAPLGPQLASEDDEEGEDTDDSSSPSGESFLADSAWANTLSHTITDGYTNILAGQLRIAGDIGDGPFWRAAADEDGDFQSLDGAAEDTREHWVDALVEMGLTEESAEDVFDTALMWMRGDDGSCPAPNRQNDNPGELDPGTGFSDDPSRFNERQQELSEIIIGTAKTMFGSDWEHAALTGSLIAFTESRMRVLANDGVLKSVPGFADEEGRTDEFPAEYYPIVARTMDMPNDGHGSAFLAVGMFQQMVHNDTWTAAGNSNFVNDQEATLERSMDPTWQVYAFFRAMDRIDGWQDMDIAELGERIQVSGNLASTQANVPKAELILDLFGDAEAIDLHPDAEDPSDPDGNDVDPFTRGTSCGSGSGGSVDGEVSTDGWAKPSEGYVTSHFGWRVDPLGVLGAKLHAGTDFYAGCGSPIYAAADGVVSSKGYDAYGANLLWIDHDGGAAQTRYYHMVKPAHVNIGDTVQAGEVVAYEGTTGWSTGCHLHFEVRVGDGLEPVDSIPFLEERGIHY